MTTVRTAPLFEEEDGNRAGGAVEAVGGMHGTSD